MKNNFKKPLDWFRLDNAAKIFPPTSHGSNTGVFRLSCELNEPVNAETLQNALDKTLINYPHMGMVLRRGFFWYYLEQGVKKLIAQPEIYPPCHKLYSGSKSPLLNVSYWKHKINIDVFHVLADGSGAIKFFQTLITNYLCLMHPEITLCENDIPSTISENSSDGFQKYYDSNSKKIKSTSAKHVYKIKSSKRDDGDLTIIEGVASAKQVLEAAHRFNTTLTIYLASVLFFAIHEQMYIRDNKKPVVLTVPVDLRAYFPTATARNFFSTIRIDYNFNEHGNEFQNIIKHTAESFKKQLTHEKLAAHMNMLSSLEHNFLLRPIPLFIKNPVLRISGNIATLGETAAISNIGKFKIAQPLHKYINGFGVFMSTQGVQLCTCTFDDNLHFGFTSAFNSADTERAFFKKLVDDGIDIEIRSNEYHKQEAL